MLENTYGVSTLESFFFNEHTYRVAAGIGGIATFVWSLGGFNVIGFPFGGVVGASAGVVGGLVLSGFGAIIAMCIAALFLLVLRLCLPMSAEALQPPHAPWNVPNISV